MNRQTGQRFRGKIGTREELQESVNQLDASGYYAWIGQWYDKPVQVQIGSPKADPLLIAQVIIIVMIIIILKVQ